MNEPWRIPDRKPAPGMFRIGPEFPGCFNTFTRPVLFNLRRNVVPSSGQRYIVCHECDREAGALAVVRGEAKGKRILRRKGWHGQVNVFKGRKAAVAFFEAWCERLQTEYDALRDRARTLKAKANPLTAEGQAAILELGDLGFA